MTASLALKLAVNGILLLYLPLPSFGAELTLRPGAQANEVFLEIPPNEACQAPPAIVVDAENVLSILDSGNRRLLRYRDLAHALPPLPLPERISSAEDVIPTSTGYVILGNSAREMIVLDSTGSVSIAEPVIGPARGNSTSRLGFNSVDNVVAVAPSGELSTNSINLRSTGASIVPSFEPAYASRRNGPNDIELSRLGESGPANIQISSKVRVNSAQVMGLDKTGKAYVRVDEAVLLPNPQTFIKVLRTDKSGVAEAEAYLKTSTLSCLLNRPVTVSHTGQVIAMWVELSGVHISEVNLLELGQNPPITDDVARAELISAAEDVFAELERMNGTSNIDAVGSSVSPISRIDVIERAESLLKHQWTPVSENLGWPKIPSECNPAKNRIWRRPHYLDPPTLNAVRSVPYRWGGYEQTLAAHSQKITDGALAGNTCTCRKKEFNYCIVKESTGWDCSGFVSFAWKIPYLTTSSLHTAGEKIAWDDLSAGDIVNAAGSHVMLVTKTGTGNVGPFVEVLHASVTCGSVCRETFAVSRLQGKYQPYRRKDIF